MATKMSHLVDGLLGGRLSEERLVVILGVGMASVLPGVNVGSVLAGGAASPRTSPERAVWRGTWWVLAGA